jgi:hypothetical protein
MNNEELYKNALEAINALYSDMDVSPEKAIENLEGLKDEIELMIEALEMRG